MKVAICDDEQGDRQRLETLVGRITGEEGIQLEMTCYDRAEALLADVGSGVQYHAMLLDVMMPGMTGMELAAALRAQQDDVTIVFISSNREMALCGYEVAAVRFLAKPVQEEKLREALRYCYQAGAGKSEITLPTAGARAGSSWRRLFMPKPGAVAYA